MHTDHCQRDADKQPIHLRPEQHMAHASRDIHGQLVHPGPWSAPHVAAGIDGRWTHKLVLEKAIVSV